MNFYVNKISTKPEYRHFKKCQLQKILNFTKNFKFFEILLTVESKIFF